MAEQLVSSIESPLKKVRSDLSELSSLKTIKIQDVPIWRSRFSWLKSEEIQDLPISFSSLQSQEFHSVMITLSLLSSLDLLSSLNFLRIGEFVWSPKLGDLQSLPSLYEDWVKNGRSNDSVSPDREDNHVSSGNNDREDNHVSSGNNEGRLDDDSRSNDVRLNVPPHGGIEEPERRTGETPEPNTGIADGSNGVESFVESIIEQWLRHQDVHLDSLKTIFENFNVKDLLMTDPLLDTVLTQKMNNVRMDLLCMLETNSELRSEELKEYYPPICWNSTKRLEFFCRLSDRLLLKARAPNQQDQLKVSLVKELESKNPPILGGQWNDKIDPNFRADRGNSPQCQYNYKSVVDLLRFIRNNWYHRLELPEEFKLKFTGQGGEKRFYDYFNERFPNLLMKSYGVASRFCREETWFENFC